MQPYLAHVQKGGSVIKNFKLIIEYDGTQYHGWQRQPNGMSIQQAVETAIETMTRRKITLIGSGRTDAGVHALGQTANFKCETRLEPDEIQKGLNSLLPKDIVIHKCLAVPTEFHARYDVKSKRYRYCILNRQLPAAIGRQYAWWIRSPLDVSAMQLAADCIVGEHDFKAFEATGSPRGHTRRRVLEARWERRIGERLTFDIIADGFLRYMVRNIVGTLVSVGQHRITPERFEEVLNALDRTAAGATAPAHGLFLVEVHYPLGSQAIDLT
jgi:tRNA pseudouridine38-40 synthase